MRVRGVAMATGHVLKYFGVSVEVLGLTVTVQPNPPPATHAQPSP